MRSERTTAPAARRVSRARVAGYGFLAGVLVTVPAIVLALLSSLGEALLDYVVPAAPILRPLSESMADWPGGVNVGLTAVLNGLVYAVLVTALTELVAAAVRARRR